MKHALQNASAGEPVAVTKCLRGSRGDARLGAARVAEHDGELAVRHRKRRVQRDRLLQEGHGPHHVDRVAGTDALRVLAQRLERPRSDLLERVARADGPERLADPLAQATRQPIHRRDDRPVVLGVFAHRDERRAIGRPDELGRNDVAAAQRIDLAVHHGLGPFALRQLARDSQGERSRVRAPHPAERLADGRGVEQPDHARLREVDP